MKILITDSQVRSAVALIRYFGKRVFYIIAADSDKISTGFFSKYTNKKFIYPDVLKSEDDFINEFSDFVNKEKVDIIFPISNEIILAIAKYRNKFDDSIKIPIADYSTLIKGTDKSLTFKEAEKIKIPIPHTYYLNDISDINKIQDFPVILKPTLSCGSRGLTLCKNSAELIKNYENLSDQFPGFIAQEYIPVNENTGGEFCWYGFFDWDSECKGYGCYKTVRSYPIGNGPSTVQESFEIEQINEVSIKLLKHLKWQGIVQIDYRIDSRDNIPKLIEINGRTWAPLAHSFHAGLDVAGLWLDLALGNRVFKQPLIKTGVKTRWLLPADILWFLSAPKTLNNIKEFFTFSGYNFDLIQKDDLKPVFGFFLASLSYLFNKEKRQLIFRESV